MRLIITIVFVALRFGASSQNDSVDKRISLLSANYKIAKIIFWKEGKIPQNPYDKTHINYLLDGKFFTFSPQQFKKLSTDKKNVLLGKNIRYNPTDTVEVFDWIYAGKGKGILNNGLYCGKVHIDTVKNTITFEKKILQFGQQQYNEKRNTLNVTPEVFAIRKLNKKELVLSTFYVLNEEKIYSLYYFKAKF